MKRLAQIFKWLVLFAPTALYLSYHPVMRLGGNETMNFELSVAVIWLVVFDAVGVVLMVGRGMMVKLWKRGGVKKWLWMLLPVWICLSVAWSLNTTRGILTAGMLVCVYIAAGLLAVVLPEAVGDADEFRHKFLKWFFGASLVACVWCAAQCIMDLNNAPQSVSLMCDGCVTAMFGFPHPNGFAIEPQFMGNLLLAPTIVSFYLMLKKFDKKLLILNFVFSSTIFLTFSRGAIYAMTIAMVFFIVMEIVRTKKWRALAGLGVMALAFVFTLNVQGVMAELSPTNDTYLTGVSKVLNHLSLGVIELPVNESGYADAVELTELAAGKEAAFDGYVAESTETRVRLTNAAMTIWSSDFKNVMVGVGIGGAGQALYNNGLSPAPKEIVQNEYASLLLETGVIGMLLFIMTAVLVVKACWRSPARGLLLTLLVAYGITLFFFSGLPNALQIYLIPAAMYGVWRK